MYFNDYTHFIPYLCSFHPDFGLLRADNLPTTANQVVGAAILDVGGIEVLTLVSP
jgi:hypothetical protein